MRRIAATLLAALLLSGCGGPVFVPEAGPHAPGYQEIAAPSLPDVELVKDAGDRPLPPGGFVDNVARQESSFEVTGWAILDPAEPRGVLQVVLPAGLDAEIDEVETLMRPDVVSAMEDDDLLWAGFSVTVSGSLPQGAGVCVLSRSRKGAFRLGGSDEGLCPP